MSMFPKKNLFSVFDSFLPSKYLLKFRKFIFFEPFLGNDIANRGGFPTMAVRIAKSLQSR